MVSDRKKKHQHKDELSQLNETLNDFVIVNWTNLGAIGKETVEPQTNGLSIKFGNIIVA